MFGAILLTNIRSSSDPRCVSMTSRKIVFYDLKASRQICYPHIEESEDSCQDLGTHRAIGHQDLGSQVPARKVPRRRYSFERYSNSNVRIWIIKNSVIRKQ